MSCSSSHEKHRVVRTIFLLSPRSGWACKKALLSQKCAQLIIKYGTSLDYRSGEWVGCCHQRIFGSLQGKCLIVRSFFLCWAWGISSSFPTWTSWVHCRIDRLIVLRAFSLPSMVVECRWGFHGSHDFYGPVHDLTRNSDHIPDLVFLFEQWQCDVELMDLSLIPLSWSDHGRSRWQTWPGGPLHNWRLCNSTPFPGPPIPAHT